MQDNRFIKAIKATIISLIVALFITGAIVLCINLFLGQKMDETISLVNKIEVDTSSKNIEEIKIDTTKKRLQNYPEYGTKYATIEIPKIEANLPVYFGDTLEILKNGVGHSSGSYFPGEGGSIVYMGHNSKNVFRRFSELEIGDTITVTTDYGKYTYQIYDMKLVNETDIDALPIQDEEEILMVYTCYPFNNIGYATQRYVVYSKLVEEE
jgi:sortase A